MPSFYPTSSSSPCLSSIPLSLHLFIFYFLIPISSSTFSFFLVFNPLAQSPPFSPMFLFHFFLVPSSSSPSSFSTPLPFLLLHPLFLFHLLASRFQSASTVASLSPARFLSHLLHLFHHLLPSSLPPYNQVFVTKRRCSREIETPSHAPKMMEQREYAAKFSQCFR